MGSLILKRGGADSRGGVAINSWLHQSSNHSLIHTISRGSNPMGWREVRGARPYRFYGLVQGGLFQLQLALVILVKVIPTLRSQRVERNLKQNKTTNKKHACWEKLLTRDGTDPVISIRLNQNGGLDIQRKKPNLNWMLGQMEKIVFGTGNVDNCGVFFGGVGDYFILY